MLENGHEPETLEHFVSVTRINIIDDDEIVYRVPLQAVLTTKIIHLDNSPIGCEELRDRITEELWNVKVRPVVESQSFSPRTSVDLGIDTLTLSMFIERVTKIINVLLGYTDDEIKYDQITGYSVMQKNTTLSLKK